MTCDRKSNEGKKMMPEEALAAAEAALEQAEILVKEVRRANVNHRRPWFPGHQIWQNHIGSGG
jgi:hypothetical protein